MSRGALTPAGAARETVLLVGTYRPAVAAARALARRGRRVIVGIGPDPDNVEGSAGVEASRHVSGVWHHAPFGEQPEQFLDELEAEVRRHEGPVFVLPLYEPVFVRLSRERQRLPAHATLVAPEPATVELCVDKERCLAVAAAAGLPSVPHELVTDHAGLLRAARELGAVAVRPAPPQARLLGRKALLAPSPGALDRVLPTWPAGHERLLVQQLIRGPRLNLHFVARDGVLIGAIEVVALRTDRPDGTGLTVEARSRRLSDGVRMQLERLLGAVNFTGAGLAQFMVDDRTGQAYLIELNPRLASIHVIAERAGLDLVNLAVDVAAGRSVEWTASRPARRVRSAWTLGDFDGFRRARGELGLGRRAQAAWLWRMLLAGLRADVHATWSWRDPRPAAVTWARYLDRTVFSRLPVRRR